MNYMSCFIYIAVTNCTPVSHDDATDTSHHLAKSTKSSRLFYRNSEFVQYPNVKTAMMKTKSTVVLREHHKISALKFSPTQCVHNDTGRLNS